MGNIRSVVLALPFLAVGCVRTHMARGNDEGRLVQNGCAMRFYRLPPQTPYEEVGHGWVSGPCVSPREAESELQKQACALGADAVVVTHENYGGRAGSLISARYVKLKTAL